MSILAEVICLILNPTGKLLESKFFVDRTRSHYVASSCRLVRNLGATIHCPTCIHGQSRLILLRVGIWVDQFSPRRG